MTKSSDFKICGVCGKYYSARIILKNNQRMKRKYLCCGFEIGRPIAEKYTPENIDSVGAPKDLSSESMVETVKTPTVKEQVQPKSKSPESSKDLNNKTKIVSSKNGSGGTS